MRSLCLLLLPLVACGGGRERPWYAELMFAQALDVEFDGAGMLHVLYVEGGGMKLATIDPAGSDRTALQGVAITRDGVPLTAVPGNGGILPDFFSLAIHPDTGTTWLYSKGLVGPVGSDGVYAPQPGLDVEGSIGLGTIEFLDGNTLFASINRQSVSMPVQGDTADGAKAEPFLVTPLNSREQQLTEICDAEVQGGLLFATPCGAYTAVWDLATRVSVQSETQSVQSETSEVSLQGRPFAAISAFGSVVSDQNGGDYCALPFDSDRPDVVVAAGSPFEPEGYCRGADAVIPNPNRIDLNDAGKAWAALYAGSGVVLFNQDRPQDATDDIKGSWCSTVSVDGQIGSFDLLDGGELVLRFGGSEMLHKEFSWSSGGGQLTVRYVGYVSFETEDEAFTYWASRVGDTLHIKGPADDEEYHHRINAGYTTLAGLWVPCP